MKILNIILINLMVFISSIALVQNLERGITKEEAIKIYLNFEQKKYDVRNVSWQFSQGNWFAVLQQKTRCS